MRRAHSHIDGPERDGETVFTPLEMSRFLIFIEERLTRAISWAIAMIVVMAASVSGFALITWRQNSVRTHDQCVSSNHGRAEIKSTFADLYDSFIKLSPPDQKQLAVAFKQERLASLDRRLPQRDC